jgi:hypothetical protein
MAWVGKALISLPSRKVIMGIVKKVEALKR